MPGRFLPALRGAIASKTLQRRIDAPDVETKAILSSYFNTLMLTAGGARDVTRPWPVERAVQEGYDRVMWVFKSVNTIATDQARLPYRIREGDSKDPLDDHPLYRVLNKQANPLETGQVFRKRLSAQIMLSKRGAFVEITRSVGGQIVRLDLLPPGRTLPIPGSGNNLIDHWELSYLDGRTRSIDVDKVRWFRDPHPLDPYSGVTPLESAGMSVELDYFSRLYNVMFMRNDGRPAGVLAVEPPGGNAEGGDMDPADMAALERKFGRGPTEAGKLSVVNGKLTYTDLAARPRDMQYAQTSNNSKIEILSAFGVPESVLGFAADRTYANAEQELYNYWTRTMLGHIEIVVAGFEEDTTDAFTGYLDTSGVEVLERHEQAKRAEARDEVAAGLRSIISYAKLAGYDNEMESTPMTRALYIPQGRTPLPATKDDEKALGLSQDTAAPAAGGPAGAAAPAASQPNEFESGGQTGSNFEPPTAGPPTPGGRGPTVPLAPATPPRAPDATERPRLQVVGGKARYRVERKAVPAPAEKTSDADLAATDALETAVAAALGSLAPRWTERTVARLESPKARKGTRHWTPDRPADPRYGTKALNAERVVDETRWVEEAVAHIERLIVDAAVTAAVKTADDLTGDTVAADAARGIVAPTVTAVLDLVRRSTQGLAETLVAELTRMDSQGKTMPEMEQVARKFGDRIKAWADTTAISVATATMNGARDAAAARAGDAETHIVRTWVSRRDAKVRPAHAAADREKQTRDIGSPFLIGDALLMYPGDPAGPPAQTYNCRCHLKHRATATGRFAAKPAAAQ